jgi:hypothetical protein
MLEFRLGGKHEKHKRGIKKQGEIKKEKGRRRKGTRKVVKNAKGAKIKAKSV